MSKDGGPAFPSDNTTTSGVKGGVTTRDYIACRALVGWISALGGGDEPPNDERLAGWAYSTADAMLAEREKES